MTINKIWPYHRLAGAVRTMDDGLIRNVDPVAIDPDAVMTIPGFPVRINDGIAIGKAAARAVAALEAVKPFLERRRIADIEPSRGGIWHDENAGNDNRDGFT